MSEIVPPSDATVEAFYRDFGRSFLPGEFRRRELSLPAPFSRMPIFEVDGNIPSMIYSLAQYDQGITSIEIEQGSAREIKAGAIAYSEGANPCVLVLCFQTSGRVHFMHAQGGYFASEERDIINKSIGGITGGGPEWLHEDRAVFKRANIEVIFPDIAEATFGLTIVRRKIDSVEEFRLPPGIYYGYS